MSTLNGLQTFGLNCLQNLGNAIFRVACEIVIELINLF